MSSVDLMSKLDEAAVAILDKALGSDNLSDAIEGFKVACGWLERKAKLQPAKPETGGKRFNELRGKLNGTNGRKAVGRGSGTQDEAEDPASLDA